MKKLGLKYKILLYFTLIFVSLFAIIWFALHFFMKEYVETEVKNQLSSANSLVSGMINKNVYRDFEKFPAVLRVRLRSITQVSKYVGDTNFMIVSGKKGTILYPGKAFVGEKEADINAGILKALNDKHVDYRYLTPFRLSAQDRVYYVSVYRLKESTNEIIFYTDVSLFENFESRMNIVLIVVFLLGGLLTAGCGFLISTRISKPVNELCRFAHSLGSGRFESCDHDFYDREFIELARDMNHMSSRLKEYDAQQKQFFQNVSHDLRTPLMSIQGYAEGIMHDVFEKPPEIAAIIAEECGQLTFMVNDLLFMSKLDSGAVAMNMEDVNLIDIVESAVRSTNGLAIKQNRRIVYAGDTKPINIKGDEQNLHRVFLNLLSNCIRHAQNTVSINITSNEKFIRVSIKDDGKGFTQNDLDNLFKRHYKGDSGEFGIGLSIVKAILDCHNANIYPGNNNGGEFVVEFKRS